MTDTEVLEQLGKSQVVRLVDVFAIAPLLIFAGMQEQKVPDWMRLGLITVGAWTAIYNGMNWLAVDAARRLEAGQQEEP